MITVTTKLHVQRERAGRKRLSEKPRSAERVPVARVPHISRLMALAIKFQGMLRDGVVRDQTELARLARVTQPRMTQILNLNFLAPDIQQEILFLQCGTVRRDAITERDVRPISILPDWRNQRALWDKISYG